MTKTNRVVLVTGASGGLGAAIVPIFEAAGYRVLGVSRSAGADGIRADLTVSAGARDAVEQAIARAGRVDVLVHLMGGFAGGRKVSEIDDATWRSMMALNLDSAFYMIRAVLPHMTELGWGRIITVGARSAVEPAPGAAAYGASKAGLVALTRAVAAEVKDARITANIVLPRTIDTPDNRRAMPKSDHSKWVTPESIAGLVLWLASDGAADVNGAVVPIYGRS